mmetsp:Transcript_33906/g.76676  ORF Transcript_33906/g.76676 Transcript_33906/m.76676 type:complete len:419 (-) Transcript_33906:760-2016(-)
MLGAKKLALQVHRAVCACVCRHPRPRQCPLSVPEARVGGPLGEGGGGDAVVRGEGQRREHHPLHVRPRPRVVFGRPTHREVKLVKDDEVLWVLVPFDVFLREADRLVQLRLQVSPRVERRVVLRVWRGAVAAVEAAAGVELGEELDPLVLARLGDLVGVGVHAEEELPHTGVARAAGEVVHGGDHREGQEAVRVPVERRQEEFLSVSGALGLEDKEVPFRLTHRGHLRRHLFDLFPDAPFEEYEAVLVAVAVEFGGEVHLEECAAELASRRLLDERARDLLQELDVNVLVGRLQNVDRPVVLLPVEFVAHVLPQGLPGGRGEGVHHVHEDGVENGARHGLQRDRDRLLLKRDGRVLGVLDLRKHVADGFGLDAALGLDGHLLLKHELHPGFPPGLRGAQVHPAEAVDHRRPHRHAAVC